MGSAMHRLASTSRTTAFGSPPLCTDAASWNSMRRIMMTPRSLSPRCSWVRSATAPWPTQATKSWFMMCEVIQRPVRGSVMGLTQEGMRPCS